MLAALPLAGTFRRFAIISTIGLLVLPVLVKAQVVQEDPEELRGIDVIEHLGDTIPMDLTFTGDDGQPVELGDYFNQGRPVIVILGYYTCPMLCNLVMNGVSEAVKEISWLPGQEFQIVSVSIDPTETEVVASAKKKNYIKDIGKPGIENGWAFLTGEESQSKALADAVGFKYYWDEDEKQYAHAAVLVVMTETGKISRYLYGISYPKLDFKLALMEASEGKVGNTIDKLILYCYHYDPDAGSYTLFAANLMRLGGGLTLAFLVILIGSLWLKGRRKRAHMSAA